mmetsp:Transcript_8956/g.24830  ORF Transcript_8956/g.24830 Transcript_8956/m.24830 type:complete len:475 (-) Transcript_8956:63-1487(-)
MGDDNDNSSFQEDVRDQQQQQSTTTSATTITVTTSRTLMTAHLWNKEEIPAVWRYGLTIYLVCILGLLFASDIGSGVEAVTRTVPDPEFQDIFDSEETVLLEASVFTSIGELWDAGSYALTIFIVLTSICWPYIKLLLTLYAWVTRYSNTHRRERLLTMLDALGKWSFVDIIVFIEIVVVFRATIPVGSGNLEVWVLPQWGLFGFISASMASLLGTHVALYFHRKVMTSNRTQQQQKSPDDPDAEQQRGSQVTNGDDKNSNGAAAEEQANGVTEGPISFQQLVGMKSLYAWLLTLCLAVAFALYLLGCILYIFKVKNIQQLTRITEVDYSIVSIGSDLNGSFREGDEGAERYMQIVWFFLGMVMPLLCLLQFGILLWWPKFSSRATLERAYFCAEILFAWSGAEVYFISTLFGVTEFSKFGDGLVDVGCSQCYKVEADFYIPELLIWGIGGVGLGLVATITISVLGHKALYGRQ